MGKGRDKKKKNKAEKTSAKSKDKELEKKLKKQSKKAKNELDEPEEDIDAILADLKQQQEEMYKVTEEISTTPPSRRVNGTLSVNPLNPAELILFGGEYFDGQKFHLFNDLYRYNTEKNEWRKITSPNSPGPRSSHQVGITPNGRLFLFGGEFVSPNETTFFHYKDFWTFDLKTNQWEKLEVKGRPSPRSGHRIAMWKQYMLVYGGFYDTYAETRYHDDLWAFDTNNYSWQKLELPDPKPSARSGCQFFNIPQTDNVLLYGGYCKEVIKGQKARGLVHTDAWILKMTPDLKNLKWERKKRNASAPSARSGCTMVCYKNRGIMLGGVSDIETEEKIESVCYNEMYQFNIDSNKWFPLTLRQSKSKKPRKKQDAKKEDESDDEFSIEKYLKGDEDGDSDDERDATSAHKPTAAADDVPETNVLAQPCPRFNTMLAIYKNLLFIYGGIFETGAKEITLADMWSVNLDKMNEFKCIVADDVDLAQWLGEDSDDEEDDEGGDGDEDDDDDEDQDDEEGDGEEGDDPTSDKDDDNGADGADDKLAVEPKPALAKGKGKSKPEKPTPVADPISPRNHDDSTKAARPAISDDTEDQEQLIDRTMEEPYVTETLREFVQRTSSYWEKRAYEEFGTLGGKLLRQDAFELAQECFNAAQPTLEIIRQQMAEAEVEEQERIARTKEQQAERLNRNRR
ncbi:galactose oxidase [Polychytrium aggregatum]|uniref:galactose oxidase n=1 Tax=Polychytrium aggregatum TaxID=110093 RepID=UPI0022FF3C00|nr:galactose oxidase [Polychytrium aggregatum]KAI9208115.1 galactose oxidase [Polychytrium aggregatum]